MAQDRGVPNGKRGDTGQRKAKVQGNNKAAALDPSSDMGDVGGLFVDPAPSERVQRPTFDNKNDNKNGANGNGRAADRRREQGRAPEPAGPKDTRTSMQQKQEKQKAPAAPPSAGMIACVKGPEAGAQLVLVDGSFTVGRARENQLVLKDIAASRKHLRIDVEGRRVRLFDLGSGNGTKVNGKRAGEVVELRHGDTIEIGSSLLMFQEAGKQAPAENANRDEAQARVVAAADELAKELSQKMKFGEGGEDDGFVAKTRALRTADARAIADELAREAQQNGNGKQKQSNDKLWNETFTNMPLSAVVPAEQPLQGQGGGRDAPAPSPQSEVPRSRSRSAMPAAAPPPQRFDAPRSSSNQQMGAVGTASSSLDDPSLAVSQMSEGTRRTSFVTSVFLSAGVVVVVGALALGLWAIFFKDDEGQKQLDAQAVINAEREAEYGTAIRRAQDAYARADWVAVRDYAVAALQTKPNDVMATTYKRDAELKLDQALQEQQQKQKAPPPPPPPAPPDPPPPPPVQETKPPPPPPPPPVVEDKPKPRPSPPKPPPPKPPSKKGMSDAEANAQFERAIDAFRSKDDETACKLLERVANRAPSDSVWKGKAESLFLKKCD